MTLFISLVATGSTTCPCVCNSLEPTTSSRAAPVGWTIFSGNCAVRRDLKTRYEIARTRSLFLASHTAAACIQSRIPAGPRPGLCACTQICFQWESLVSHNNMRHCAPFRCIREGFVGQPRCSWHHCHLQVWLDRQSVIEGVYRLDTMQPHVSQHVT